MGSHVKNKVAKQDAKDKAAEEKADIEGAGNAPALADGKGTVPLKSGPLEVVGNWDASGERVVIMLEDLNTEPAKMKGIMDGLVAQDCRVLCPLFNTTTQKEIEADM